MEAGNSYRVKSFKDKEIEEKLLVLGFLPHSEFQFIRKSPLGGAYYFSLNGNKIALRKEEANAIIVE